MTGIPAERIEPGTFCPACRPTCRTPEVARLFDVGDATLTRLVRRGAVPLPVVVLGNRGYRFPRAAVHSLFEVVVEKCLGCGRRVEPDPAPSSPAALTSAAGR